MRGFFFLALFLMHFWQPANLLAENESDSLKQHLHFVKGNEKLEILQTLSFHYLFRSLDSCEKHSIKEI